MLDAADDSVDCDACTIEDALTTCDGSTGGKVTKEYIPVGFSPPQAFPNGSSVTFGGVTVPVPDGQLFDESPDNPNAVPASIPWIAWLNDQFPTANFAYVPTSGQDSTWACGSWSIQVGARTLDSIDVTTIDPDFPDAYCEPKCAIRVKVCGFDTLLDKLDTLIEQTAPQICAYCTDIVFDGRLWNTTSAIQFGQLAPQDTWADVETYLTSLGYTVEDVINILPGGIRVSRDIKRICGPVPLGDITHARGTVALEWVGKTDCCCETPTEATCDCPETPTKITTYNQGR